MLLSYDYYSPMIALGRFGTPADRLQRLPDGSTILDGLLGEY